MTEKKFSRFKAASFISVLLLVFTSFVVTGFGVNQIVYESAFYGTLVTLSGLVCMASAVMVYLNYQKKNDERIEETASNN